MFSSHLFLFHITIDQGVQQRFLQNSTIDSLTMTKDNYSNYPEDCVDYYDEYLDYDDFKIGNCRGGGTTTVRQTGKTSKIQSRGGGIYSSKHVRATMARKSGHDNQTRGKQSRRRR
mmetsp:Transcript_18437/g.38021  ORF Transcript_18437/g.38021 Transcript_18437/m.38021 type:complete len:116 (-) Transcript_18437:1345-1692(-)